MIKKLRNHVVFMSVFSLLGMVIMGPVVKSFSNWAVEQELKSQRLSFEERDLQRENHYNDSPIDEFIVFEGVRANDVTLGDETQKLKTVVTPKIQVGAFGPHSMFCLVSGELDENGYIKRQSVDDYLVFNYNWEEAWRYTPTNEPTGSWIIDIDPAQYGRCGTKKAYWRFKISIIMPNGTVRGPVIFYSDVFDIKQ